MSNRKKILRAVRRSKEAKQESNDSVHRKMMKKAGQHRCRICPEWKGENTVDSKPKRGTKKPRYKNKR